MGKITLLILLLAIALGVYWFWWSDQGANSPITAEGTISVSGMFALPGMPAAPGAQGPGKVDFTLQAVPNKLRVAGNVGGKLLSVVVRLDKRQTYFLNQEKKVYAVQEFDFVDTSETELREGEETWPTEFKKTADWDYIGKGDDKLFCNKQTMKGLPKDFMDATKAVPGAGEANVQAMQALFSNLECEFWFTPETRLGRRYFATLNKVFRIQSLGARAPADQKRPQFNYVNLDFFPIPLKATLSMGPMKIQLDVNTLSRKKILKEVFEIPSGYTKVGGPNEVME